MKTTMFAALALTLSCTVGFAQDKAEPKAAQPTQTPAPAKEQAKLQYAQFETSAGTFVLELNYEKAPISVANFMQYVDKGFYDGTIFHRTIPDFMIQGGGMTADKKPKRTEKPIVNEHSNGLKNMRGTISMARTNDPNSATSQFFINVADNDGSTRYNLDQGHGYAVFGRVISGMDVVDKIRNAPTIKDGSREESTPVEPVVVTKATRLSSEDAQKFLKTDAKGGDKPKDEPKKAPAGEKPQGEKDAPKDNPKK